MKGLLVKDVCILKMQKNVLLIFIGDVCGVYCFFGKSDIYCESDAACTACIVVLGTLEL